MTMTMYADHINTIVLAIGKSPRLHVTVSGPAVEYMQRPAVVAIAQAAAEAAGYVPVGEPIAELFGGNDQAKVTFPEYTK